MTKKLDVAIYIALLDTQTPRAVNLKHILIDRFLYVYIYSSIPTANSIKNCKSVLPFQSLRCSW